MKTGIDLIQISRFKKLKNNKTFMTNNFTSNEIKYIENSNYNLSVIAGIYASKEAFLKAIKMGINNYSLKDIEIIHNDNNAPFIKLHNNLLLTYKNNVFNLSISHDGDYAIAIVILS